MTNQNLLALILGDEVRITQAITTGAAWEVWMQVELVVLLLQAGLQAARELPYPPPNSTWRLDIGAQDSQGHTKSCYNKTSKDEEIKCPRKLT
jgi:hypothetical protein